MIFYKKYYNSQITKSGKLVISCKERNYHKILLIHSLYMPSFEYTPPPITKYVQPNWYSKYQI